MKKIVAILLALALAFALAACGASGAPSGPSSGSTPPAAANSGTPSNTDSSDPVTLAFVIPGTNSQYWNQYCGTGCMNAITDIEKEYGVTVNATMYGATDEGDTESYLGIMESTIATRPDIIITATMEENGTISVVKDAYNAGIYLNFFSLGIAAGNDEYFGALYYCDQPQQGEVAGEFIGGKLIEKYGDLEDWSEYYVGAHLATSTSVLEQKMEMFSKKIAEVCPGINVLDTLYNENDVNTAQANVENQISTYGDKLVAIFGGNNVSGDGIVLAVKNSGRTDIISCAVDSDETEIEGLVNGHLTAILCQTPYAQTYYATYDALKAFLDGVDLDTFNNSEPSYNYPCTPVTAENMEETEYAALLDPTTLALWLAGPVLTRPAGIQFEQKGRVIANE